MQPSSCVQYEPTLKRKKIQVCIQQYSFSWMTDFKKDVKLHSSQLCGMVIMVFATICKWPDFSNLMHL